MEASCPPCFTGFSNFIKERILIVSKTILNLSTFLAGFLLLKVELDERIFVEFTYLIHVIIFLFGIVIMLFSATVLFLDSISSFKNKS